MCIRDRSTIGGATVDFPRGSLIYPMPPVSTIVGGAHRTRSMNKDGVTKSMLPYLFNDGGTGNIDLDVENILGQKITVSTAGQTNFTLGAPANKLGSVGQTFDVISVNGDNPEDLGKLKPCTGSIYVQLSLEDSLIYSGDGSTMKHITQFLIKPVIDSTTGAPTLPTNEMGITAHLRFTYDYRLPTDYTLSSDPTPISQFGWRVSIIFLATDWVAHLDGQSIPSWSDSLVPP